MIRNVTCCSTRCLWRHLCWTLPSFLWNRMQSTRVTQFAEPLLFLFFSGSRHLGFLCLGLGRRIADGLNRLLVVSDSSSLFMFFKSWFVLNVVFSYISLRRSWCIESDGKGCPFTNLSIFFLNVMASWGRVGILNTEHVGMVDYIALLFLPTPHGSDALSFIRHY